MFIKSFDIDGIIFKIIIFDLFKRNFNFHVYMEFFKNVGNIILVWYSLENFSYKSIIS
jgi:hypothetical protein